MLARSLVGVRRTFSGTPSSAFSGHPSRLLPALQDLVAACLHSDHRSRLSFEKVAADLQDLQSLAASGNLQPETYPLNLL